MVLITQFIFLSSHLRHGNLAEKRPRNLYHLPTVFAFNTLTLALRFASSSLCILNPQRLEQMVSVRGEREERRARLERWSIPCRRAPSFRRPLMKVWQGNSPETQHLHPDIITLLSFLSAEGGRDGSTYSTVTKGTGNRHSGNKCVGGDLFFFFPFAFIFKDEQRNQIVWRVLNEIHFLFPLNPLNAPCIYKVKHYSVCDLCLAML